MTTLSANPLYDLEYQIPFDRIEAEHVEPAVEALVAAVRDAVAKIGQDTSAPTYDNTLGALEDALDPLDRSMTVVGHLESVRTSEALRAAYNRVRPMVSELYSSITLDPALYARLVAFEATPEADALPPTKRRFLEKELRSFRRNGADLDPEDKARLTEVDVELTKLTTKFMQNLLDETNEFEILIDDESRLAGLPASARDAARASARSKDREGWRFTLQPPSLIAVLTYLDDRAVREHMWRAYNTRASSGERDNRPLIARILELRSAKAKLLGYDNFADFVLEERMAKTGSRARVFLQELIERTQPHFEEECAALKKFAPTQGGPQQLEAWDVAYYAEKLRKAQYDFDEEELRPYLSAAHVLDGLFSVASRLYGVAIERWDGAPTWNDAVQTYRVTDGDHTIGAFYVDLFPREDKRGGAWMNTFVVGGPTADGFNPHLGLFCANVTPPIDDQPALLTHDEVRTLFHEFGHLLHLCLSEVEVRSLAGTSVAWDFVELPSQIMENWTWEREALDLFARHHETGAPIPEPLFAKMQRARNFRAASTMMRQLGYAHTDLSLHVNFDPARDGDPVPYARKCMLPFQPTSLPDDYAMICHFTHLFSSAVAYAAGYYSYKWAEVLEADAFTRFLDAGVFDADVGSAFRKHILARGDSADPGELFHLFMGREPSADALFVRSGLESAPAAP